MSLQENVSLLFCHPGPGVLPSPHHALQISWPPTGMAFLCHPCPATWHTIARPPRCLPIVSPWGYLQLGEPLSAWSDLLCPLPESLHLKPANKMCTELSGAKLKWPRKASLNVSTTASEITCMIPLLKIKCLSLKVSGLGHVINRLLGDMAHVNTPGGRTALSV